MAKNLSSSLRGISKTVKASSTVSKGTKVAGTKGAKLGSTKRK